MSSEKVTWETCPRCGGPVALGWLGQTVTEIDCTSACELTDSHRESVRRAATQPGGR